MPPLRSTKVLDQLRERIGYLHYSIRTEQAYVQWVRAFMRFHGLRHPATLGCDEIEAFLAGERAQGLGLDPSPGARRPAVPLQQHTWVLICRG